MKVTGSPFTLTHLRRLGIPYDDATRENAVLLLNCRFLKKKGKEGN